MRQPDPGPRALTMPLLLLALAASVVAQGCRGSPELETRTFEIRHLEPGRALEMVEPYIYRDRPEAPGTATAVPGGITVRETEDNLARIARALERFDRPTPGVRLTFQIIEADGDTARDDRIAGVESVLRDLFRFEGYRLVAEAHVAAVEGGSSTQVIREAGRQFGIMAEVHRVRAAGERGSVRLEVRLMTQGFGGVIQTSMTVPVGQTVVVGSAKPEPDQPTLILTVRPQFVDRSPEEGEGS